MPGAACRCAAGSGNILRRASCVQWHRSMIHTDRRSQVVLRCPGVMLRPVLRPGSAVLPSAIQVRSPLYLSRPKVNQNSHPASGNASVRPHLLLFLVLTAITMGQTMVFAVLAPLGREAGLVEMQIGAIISASSLSFFLTSPIWGRVSDHWGRRPVMMIGLFSYCLGTLIFSWMFHLTLIGVIGGGIAALTLALTRMGQSTLMSAALPAAIAYMADVTTSENRVRGMGIVGAAQNFGSIMGPAVGGFLTVITLLMPFWTAAGMALLAGTLVLFLLPDVPSQARPATGTRRMRYTDVRILPFIVIGCFAFISFAVAQQTLAFRIQDMLQLNTIDTARTFGIAMMISGLASLCIQGSVVMRSKASSSVLLCMGMPILFVAFALLSMATTLVPLLTAVAILGLGMGLIGPSFVAAASLAVRPEEQGAVAGVVSSCMPLGFIVGPLLGTFLYQWDGRLPYVVIAFLCLPMMLFCLQVMRRRRPRSGL